jgi:hypothetical protein
LSNSVHTVGGAFDLGACDFNGAASADDANSINNDVDVMNRHRIRNGEIDGQVLEVLIGTS